MLLLDFNVVSNDLIDCPVSIAVELAIERIIRAFSCSFLTEAFIFIMGTLKVVHVSFHYIVFSHYCMSKNSFVRECEVNNVGQRERSTQNRVVKLFKDDLGYQYLGNWEYRENNRNVEPEILTAWLRKQGVNDILIAKALRQIDTESALGEGKKLYYANKEVYRLFVMGLKTKRERVNKSKPSG